MLRLRKIDFVLDSGNSFNRLPAVYMADPWGAALDFTCVILGNAVKLEKLMVIFLPSERIGV